MNMYMRDEVWWGVVFSERCPSVNYGVREVCAGVRMTVSPLSVITLNRTVKG